MRWIARGTKTHLSPDRRRTKNGSKTNGFELLSGKYYDMSKRTRARSRVHRQDSVGRYRTHTAPMRRISLCDHTAHKDLPPGHQCDNDIQNYSSIYARTVGRLKHPQLVDRRRHMCRISYSITASLCMH